MDLQSKRSKNMKKYNYYKVIQSNHGNGWDDESFYECKANGAMALDTLKSLKHDVKEYRLAYHGAPVRVIFRRELAQCLPNS